MKPLTKKVKNKKKYIKPCIKNSVPIETRTGSQIPSYYSC